MRSRPLRLFAVSAALLAPSAALAANSHRSTGHTGLGVGGGTRSGGLSVKHFVSDNMALQGVVGSYGGWGGGGLGLSGDYLYEMPLLAQTDAGDLGWNIGPGVGVGFYPEADILAVSAAGVLGLEFAFAPVPLDLVIEYRPSLLIVPTIDFDLVHVTGHLRWFF